MKRRTGQQGTALMFALFVIVILSLGTTVLWRQLHGNLEQSRMAWRQEAAFQLAEAGLNRGIAEIRAQGPSYGGVTDAPLGPGTFTLIVTPGNAPGTYEMTSTGMLTNAAYHYEMTTLSASVTLGPNGLVSAYGYRKVLRGELP